MKKIFLLILLAFLLAACGSRSDEISEPYENAEPEAEIVGEYENEYENSGPEIPDIPRFNEYRVLLEIDPAERFVSGISNITFTNRASAPLDEIVLRVYLNAFREDAYPPPVFSELEWRAFPSGRDYGYMEIQYASLDGESLEFRLDETVLTLILPEPLEPYATVQLLLQYNAKIPEIAHRTGSNDYALWFGMFLPVLAVFDDENSAWHTEPHYPAGSPFLLETANFSVEITTPIRYIVVGTGLRTEEVIGDTGIKITRFVAHQARDFAFAVSPYFRHAFTETAGGIDIHLYYYTETLDLDEILDVSRRSLEYFEERVGIFPLGNVTIIETELIHDSMSFSQVVFVDSWYLGRGGRYWGLAHGLGNQWFANVVGTNRISEPWLTEGLTRFVQAGIFYPTPEALRARMERDHASIEDRRTMYLSSGLYASPNHPHYAHTHGRKAMLMLYALNDRMGDELFWELIAEYYRRFSFDIASANDFIELAEELYGEGLRGFFAEWFETGSVPELP